MLEDIERLLDRYDREHDTLSAGDIILLVTGLAEAIMLSIKELRKIGTELVALEARIEKLEQHDLLHRSTKADIEAGDARLTQWLERHEQETK